MPISGLLGKERKKSKEADLETCWSHHRGFFPTVTKYWCYGYGIDIFLYFLVYLYFSSISIFLIYLDSYYQAVIRGALRQQTAFTLVLLAMERLMMILVSITIIIVVVFIIMMIIAMMMVMVMMVMMEMMVMQVHQTSQF